MLKKYCCLSLLVSFITFSFYSHESYAANESECAIWLCSPAGFPEGCAAAHAAMLNRIKQFKPIYPPLSSCKDEHDQIHDDIFSYSGNATLIKSHEICTEWGGHNNNICKSKLIIPTHYIKDVSCVAEGSSKDGNRYYVPTNCIANVYYAEVHDDVTKTKIGKTYFIAKNGNNANYYPAVSSEDYYGLYKARTKKTISQYISKIESDRQRGIDFDNEYNNNIK